MEKRLYRSGYHVTGKKSKHAVESSDNASTKPNNRANKKNEIAGVISINENTIVDSTKLNEKNITASTDNSIFIPASETSEPTITNSIKENNVKSDSKTTIKSEREKTHSIDRIKNRGGGEESGGVGRGLYMIILGLALLGLGYLAYIGLGVFGVVLFMIGAIAAAIFIIAGIVIMIIG